MKMQWIAAVAACAVLCAAPQWLETWNLQAGRAPGALPAHPADLATATWLEQSRTEPPQLAQE